MATTLRLPNTRKTVVVGHQGGIALGVVDLLEVPVRIEL
jgi:hypothetical protein